MLQEIVEILIAMVQIAPTFGTLGKIFVKVQFCQSYYFT